MAAPELPRLSLRIDLGPGRRIGPGKVRLLEAVAAHGSIAAAGRALGMSYRRAWELADALNRCFPEPVIVSQAGGARGGGARLTAQGADLVRRYRAIEAAATDAAATDLAGLAAGLGPCPADPEREVAGGAQISTGGRP